LFPSYPGYPNGARDVVEFLGEEETSGRIKFINATQPFQISVTTPNVLREVRDFFGCDTMSGARLEDDGGLGSATGHWETRLFQVRSCTRQRNACFSPLMVEVASDMVGDEIVCSLD
jgi:hypothetical protein